MLCHVRHEQYTKLHDTSVRVAGMFYTDITLLSAEELAALNIYPLEFVHVDVPAGYIGDGSSLTLHNGTVYEVPLLKEE